MQKRKSATTYDAHARKLEARRAYGRTPRGFLIMRYYDMKARIEGKRKFPHLYIGKPILSLSEFLTWSLNDLDFNVLFKRWAKNGYPVREGPSINRLDGNGGYTLGNMNWVPYTLNMALGGVQSGVIRRTQAVNYQALERIHACL